MTDHRAMGTAFTLFDTAVGACALAWGEHGIVGVALQSVVDRIQALLQGGQDDLADIALDFRGLSAFNLRVYAYARAIPPGQTRSYGEVAAALGEGAPLARAVGQALGANPFPIIVPCHRVLAAGSRAGGFSAPGGTRTKLRLLEIEGALLGGTPGLFDR